MKERTKSFILLTLLLVISSVLYAVPAIPYPVTFTQPNGDTLTVRIKGDERMHWHESMDEYTLLFNQDGYLTYAQLDEEDNLQPSVYIATNIEERDIVVISFLNTINRKLFYSDVQKQLMLQVWEIEDEVNSRGERDVIGQYKTLCAFVQFPEKSFTKQMSDFENLMNQIGYTGNGTGSVRDFFKESSYNNFDLIITLCGIYTAPQSESYYAGSDGTQNCQALARWAAQQVAADPNINFADYDSDNNGEVDGFHFIFAGRGQEAGGGSSTIWSHKWQFYPPVTKNGKSISVYSCSPELYNSNITTIGVICHEMTHAFGAPDFYDTNYETGGQYNGTGQWDIMAGGSWNGSPGGNRPPHHNMYTKMQFGWVTPIVLSQPTTVINMPNSAQNPVAYRINTPTNNEYYLLENRQKVKFDTDVPGSGLLIYHVHSSVGTSCINCTHPQRMYPVCASSTTAIPASGNPTTNYGNINSAGCPFPGSSNKTSFNGTSTPRMFRWTNTVISDKPITNITHSNQLISFDFMGGGDVSYTITATAGANGTIAPNGDITVDYGANQTFNFTPNTGYHIDQVLVDNVNNPGAVSSGTYTFTNVTANHTISVTFANNYTITASADANGTISPNGNVTVNPGANQTFTFTPNTGYHIDQVLVDNVNNPGAVSSGSYTFSNVMANHTISVIFTIDTYTITASAGTNGTISPNGNITVNSGANQTFTFTPNTGYYIDQVLVDNVNNPGAVSSGTYTFTNVTSNHTISVTFAINTYTITATAGANGTISPDGNVTVNHGENQTFTFTPNTGYHIDQVLVDNVNNPDAVSAGSYTFTNITANHSISVTFTINTYTITAVADVNGMIDPTGNVTVNHGDNQTFTFNPNTGFHIADVLVDDVSNSEAVTNGSYIFTNVTANHTIAASFAIIDNIAENELNNIKVYSFQNSVYIENEMDVAIKSVEILDMYGRLIYQGFISGEKTVIPLQVAEGIYNVKLVLFEDTMVSKKVLIRK